MISQKDSRGGYKVRGNSISYFGNSWRSLTDSFNTKKQKC